MLKNVILPAADRFAGQRMMQRLRFLERAQWWDPERLHRHRDLLLQHVWQLAYHETPFYREHLDAVGKSPRDIRSASDLLDIPPVTKDMLRRAYPNRVTRQTGYRMYESKTSGSTGENFIVAEDTETAGWYRASFLLALGWSGWLFGERHMQTGMAKSRSFDRRVKDHLLQCHYISAAQLDNYTLDCHLATMEKHGIKHLWGYPGSLYCLSRRAKDVGWNIPLASVVTWGDNLYASYRSSISSAFRTPVYDTYGCAEGIQVSAQCGRGDIYHVHSLDVIVEYVEEAGTPVKPGQRGDILLTRLHAGPMPLLRYRVGDVGTSGNEEMCACGRGFDQMAKIDGRDTDVVLTPSGNRLIVHFFTGVLEHFPEIRSFQIVQKKSDSIELRLVPENRLSVQQEELIKDALKERGASDLEIYLMQLEDIPLTPGGKRRFIIRESYDAG